MHCFGGEEGGSFPSVELKTFVLQPNCSVGSLMLGLDTEDSCYLHQHYSAGSRFGLSKAVGLAWDIVD